MGTKFEIKETKKGERIMYQIVVLREPNDSILNQLMELRRKAFPSGWNEYADISYYAESIIDPKNLVVVLLDGENLLGFLLATPHNVAREDLIVEDPLMEEKENCFYVETIEMSPELTGSLAGGRSFFRMMQVFVSEAAKMGINYFSMHARADSGLSDVIKRYFKHNENIVRRIEKWPWNIDGPVDYIAGKCRRDIITG